MAVLGRKKETSFLEEQCAIGHSLVLISGRSMVGKSLLAQSFAEAHRGFFFAPDCIGGKVIQKQFLHAVEDLTGVVIDRSEAYEGAFRALVENGHYKLIVIDDVNFFLAGYKGFLGAFCNIWDSYLSAHGVTVILCCSKFSFDQVELGLGGRVTSFLSLEPVDFTDTAGKKNYRRALEEYAFTGGIPYYMSLMDSEQSAEDNAIRLSLMSDSAFLNEPELLIKRCASDPFYYEKYLGPICEGKASMGEISAVTGVSTQVSLPYIDRLISMGLVRREVSILDDPRRSRKGRYVPADPFIGFWYRFVRPYRNDIARGISDEAIGNLQIHYQEYVASVFSEVCRSELRRHLSGEGSEVVCGAYWHNDIDVPVSAVDTNDGTLYIGCCTYANNPVPGRDIISLLVKCQMISLKENRRIVPCMFSVSGYSEAARTIADSEDVWLFDCGEPVTSRSSSS